jgi:hypothetical protein
MVQAFRLSTVAGKTSQVVFTCFVSLMFVVPPCFIAFPSFDIDSTPDFQLTLRLLFA